MYRVSPCRAMSEQGKSAWAQTKLLKILKPHLTSTHSLVGQQGARLPTAGTGRPSLHIDQCPWAAYPHAERQLELRAGSCHLVKE